MFGTLVNAAAIAAGGLVGLVPPLWVGLRALAAGFLGVKFRRFSTFFTVCVEREACYGSRTIH